MMSTTAEATTQSAESETRLAELVDKHHAMLEAGCAANQSREFYSAFPESPSPRVYGETAAAEGEQAYQRLLGSRFDLAQPSDGSWVGSEVSPYGPQLGVEYPHARPGQLIDAARTAVTSWQAATPEERAAIGAEILTRLNARAFELAHTVMHTSGQAFVMAFQAGGTHAQDRGLEAICYGLSEQNRIRGQVTWTKPQGKRDPLTMIKTFTPVGRGVALLIGCNTFPTWNAYPGLFASLTTGNAVIVKPHPRAVLPLAVTVSVCRQVLSEYGFDPNVVLLAAEADDEGIAKDLATDAAVGVIDFTGSSAFGDWLGDHARQAELYAEKAGVNTVILESTDAYRAALDNLAFTLSLYSGQMCTTTQDLIVPAGGIETDEGHKSVSEVGDDLGAALGKLLSDDEKAAAILGAIVNGQVAQRLMVAKDHGPVLVDTRPVAVKDWPSARIATPLVVGADASAPADRERIGQECFGPVTFLVQVPDRDRALTLFEELTIQRGALTTAVYSTDEEFLNRYRAGALRSGVSWSENLTGGVFVNQTAAFSDLHATGANPAATACFTDSHFVAGRFRVIEGRRHP
jgi:phenylacetic acid degradation protein paaN